MSQSSEKPDLGFNRHTLLGFLVSVFFIGVTPLIMFPARTGTAPLFFFLFFLVATIFYVRGTRRFLFWTLQSGVWACVIALGLITTGIAFKNKEIVESKGPISVQSLKENPPTGPFLLSGASLDTKTAGSYRWCRQVSIGQDLRYPDQTSYTEKCDDVGVTALVAPGKESGESEIVGWVVQKNMLVALPKFFGDSAPFPLTTSPGMFSKDQSHSIKARENASINTCLKWANAGTENFSVTNYLACPALHAPFLYPVNIVVPNNLFESTTQITGGAIGLHAFFGWLIVLCLVLKRGMKEFLYTRRLERLYGKAPRERRSGRLKGPRKRD
jgi:hypothetical protein